MINSAADVINADTECTATEDLIATIDEINKDNESTLYNLDTVSLDAVSLYPSLKEEETSEVVSNMVVESGLVLDNVDWEEVGVYLFLTHREEELVDLGIDVVCLPTRKNTGGHKPGITTAEVLGPIDRDQQKSLLTPPRRRPNEDQQKMMLKELLRTAIKVVLKNHIYKFAGVTRRQKEGGPIGNELAQALARMYLVWWDRRFLDELGRFGVHVLSYKRYVDDVNPICRRLEQKISTNEDTGEIVAKDIIEQERSDENTAESLKAVANSITNMVKWTCDFPTNNAKKRMPVLDLETWSDGSKILYSFYRKEVASPFTILSRSAMPEKIKRITLTMEVIRILKNTSKELPWISKANMLTNLAARMKVSGYGEAYRLEVVQQGILGYQRMLERENEGGPPVNRPKNYRRIERSRAKREKKSNWYRGKGEEKRFSTVMFVPATPGSHLIRAMVEKEEQNNQGRDWRVKFVEKGGTSLKWQVQKNNPWSGTGCQDQECFSCSSSTDKKPDCRRTGVGYRISCLECRQEGRVVVYEGETGRNMNTRGREHLRDLKDRKTNKPLWSHCLEQHDGREVCFSMEMVGTFLKPLARSINEGVRIKRCEGELMNSRAEWRQPSVSRVSFTRMNRR